uniref:Uncharacterized protein n=1 Tax=Arundo donax TaxID=35708 RepID=A0A0A8Z4J9_ARUDO
MANTIGNGSQSVREMTI